MIDEDFLIFRDSCLKDPDLKLVDSYETHLCSKTSLMLES
jgi:hypothetical protein